MSQSLPSNSEASSRLYIVGTIAAIGLSSVLILKSGAQFFKGGSAEAIQVDTINQSLDIEGERKGNELSARVAVIEFSDFRCPFCGEFARETQPQLFAQYVDSGTVLWLFRHLPLVQLHPDAREMAKVAYCSGRQGKFWAVHDFLFDHQRSAALTSSEASALFGLGAPELERCLATGTSTLDRDLQVAAGLGVVSTPTFVIGSIGEGRVAVRKIIRGAASTQVFQATIDAIVQHAGAR